jgi:eukaryotic-like serine/threonine-protein kinase
VNRDEWERLKPLFHGAVEQPPSRRGEWLRAQCDDDAVRREVLALLHSYDTAGDFLEAPATLDPAEQAGEPVRQIGPYSIRGELGRGGMGVVYLAEDRRLGRTVALKALPDSFANDPGRRERLRREARAAAALTHPGIAIVYALEEIDGALYIASEHVRGRTLRAELAEGPLGPARAHVTAIEIVRALCAAHEAGIVHRDLKPENVLRTDEGGIKILDFGIAQFTDHTLTQLTAAGAVIGTPAYMAPEQLVGPDVDFRADIYAVGVLIVEMATGRHPFATGDSPRARRCRKRCARSRIDVSRAIRVTAINRRASCSPPSKGAIAGDRPARRSARNPPLPASVLNRLRRASRRCGGGNSTRPSPP